MTELEKSDDVVLEVRRWSGRPLRVLTESRMNVAGEQWLDGQQHVHAVQQRLVVEASTLNTLDTLGNWAQKEVEEVEGWAASVGGRGR